MMALRALLTILALVAGGPAVADEDYPSRPITIIVPWAAGATTTRDHRGKQYAEQPACSLHGSPFLL